VRATTRREDPATRQSFIVAALQNRRRISSEGMQIRQYLDRRLAERAGKAIIVLGDLNDGPGMDYFEHKYLSHNVTDIIIGSAFAPEAIFTHAQHDVAAEERYTAVFEDFVPSPVVRRLLLDHIMLSPGLTGLRGAKEGAPQADGRRRGLGCTRSTARARSATPSTTPTSSTAARGDRTAPATTGPSASTSTPCRERAGTGITFAPEQEPRKALRGARPEDSNLRPSVP
jgi:hypothetical protein